MRTKPGKFTSTASSNQLRQELAQLAARYVAVDGVVDFLQAKRKAAARLGIQHSQQLPSNREIEQALLDYQRLFQAESQPQTLMQMRETALAAMQFLHEFKPRLAGPVADGTATLHSEINLHLYSDTCEAVALLFLDQSIPFLPCDRRIRLNATNVVQYPAYQFVADGFKIVLIVLPCRDRNQTPVSPIDNQPMRRLNIAELQALVSADQPPH